jgi:hypothetical protein
MTQKLSHHQISNRMAWEWEMVKAKKTKQIRSNMKNNLKVLKTTNLMMTKSKKSNRNKRRVRMIMTFK